MLNFLTSQIRLGWHISVCNIEQHTVEKVNWEAAQSPFGSVRSTLQFDK